MSLVNIEEKTVWQRMSEAKSKYNKAKKELDIAVKNCIRSMIRDKSIGNHIVTPESSEAEALCGVEQDSKIVLCPACCNKFEEAFRK